LRLALSTITQLRSLVILRLRIRGSELSYVDQFIELKTLAALPSLRAFALQQTQVDQCCRDRGLDCWVRENTLSTVAIGLTSVVKLRKIDWSALPLWSEACVPSLVAMLSNLQNLLELRTLHMCPSSFWKAFHKAGGHKELRHLGLMYFKPPPCDLEAMVRGVTNDMPKLEMLTLRFYETCTRDPNDSEIVEALQFMQETSSMPTAPRALEVCRQWLTVTLSKLKDSLSLQAIELEEDEFTSSSVIDACAIAKALGVNGPRLWLRAVDQELMDPINVSSALVAGSQRIT
jgi:hypothetical protein